MYGISFLLAPYLVGGFNPFEKYFSKWECSPSRDENKTYLKPPPSYRAFVIQMISQMSSLGEKNIFFKHSGNNLMFILENIPSLKLTASCHLKMDGWKMKCPVGKASFCGAMLVSWRVISFQFSNMCPLRMYLVTTYRYASISGEEKTILDTQFRKTHKKTTQRAN